MSGPELVASTTTKPAMRTAATTRAVTTVDEQHPPPAQLGGENAAEDDPGQARRPAHDAPQGQGVLPLVLIGVAGGNEAEAGGGQCRGAGALDDPGRE
jgi:hypothetical protein